MRSAPPTLAGCLLAVALVAACRGSGNRCEQAARAGAAAFLRQAGTPGLKTMTNVVAARFEATLRARCRADGWSADATTCLRRGDMGCWRAALSTEQGERFEDAMAAVVDELRPSSPEGD